MLLLQLIELTLDYNKIEHFNIYVSYVAIKECKKGLVSSPISIVLLSNSLALSAFLTSCKRRANAVD